MKLLDKHSVSVQVAIDKKRQIDQGITLARKVDVLRETKLKEEADLAQFRSETIARTQAEIDAKIKEKNVLEAKIKAREEELKALREPLDDEWQAFEEAKTALQWDKHLVYERKGELDRGIALNIRRERENKEEKQRVAKERERSALALSEAESKHEIASDVLMKARSKADKMSQASETRERMADSREKQLEQREREAERETRKLKAIEKEQKRKDKEIFDKYETLNRDIKRIHGKRKH